ncbi:hypothetical protein GYH30_054345 [Glycine max]|uniref:Uncharacterized protein n=1 Tax=Glycine max TaxID=3847 RepID=K7N0J7_SOYBN|nr:hypothetical protein GYH30_054345 [Glycine max]
MMRGTVLFNRSVKRFYSDCEYNLKSFSLNLFLVILKNYSTEFHSRCILSFSPSPSYSCLSVQACPTY